MLKLFVRGRRTDIDDLLRSWSLDAHARTPFGRLSGGLRQRLFIALALINRPRGVFLDELTRGLNPLARQDRRNRMKAQRLLLIALTLVNVFLLTFTVFRPSAAEAQGAEPVLRGRALEIVDDRGRVRASITVFPADTTTGYPETVLLRLRTSEGRPNVKIAATEDGSGLVLGGKSNPTFVQALARGARTSLKLKNKDGRERLIKP